MDPAALTVLFTAFFGAISTLFWLYVRELQGQITALKTEKNTLAIELRTVSIKAEEAVRDEQNATRQELAELRKTNATLVASLSGKGATA